MLQNVMPYIFVPTCFCLIYLRNTYKFSVVDLSLLLRPIVSWLREHIDQFCIREPWPEEHCRKMQVISAPQRHFIQPSQVVYFMWHPLNSMGCRCPVADIHPHYLTSFPILVECNYFNWCQMTTHFGYKKYYLT